VPRDVGRGGSLNRLGDWVNRRYLKFRKNYQLSA
jgi:hypothetical protein